MVGDLDAFIANVKQRTGAEQVDILAHSRGTTVMHTYLSSPERAASVRSYVNFDGRTSETPPGGVRTLAVWGEGDQTRAIGGAENVYFANKAHTEVTTSPDAFADVYEFLTGEKPETTDVVPENPKKVKVAGRALVFPNNVGIEGGRLRIFELDDDTVSIAVTRMREFWGDQASPAANDKLQFNGLNVINSAIAPRARRVLAVFNFDKNSDQVTDTSASLSPFNSIGFLTGVDNYMPSSPDASGTIAVKETVRKPYSHKETINVPDWPSDAATASVYFKDYEAEKFKPKR